VSESGVARSNPFPGLRAFESRETHLFFGRDGQSDELLRLLARGRFVAVVGTSGCGKSSLVRAGMLPALRSGFMTDAGSSWHLAILRPGASPIAALAESVAAATASGNGELDAATRQILAETTLRRSSFGLVEAVRQAWMGSDENLLVLADQFEEIFRLRAARRQAPTSEDESAAFVSLLLEAIGQIELPIYVAITMRSDFLGDCAEFPGLPETLNRSQYLVPRMTRDQRRAAIEGPVAVSGATIAPRLVQRLLNDIGDDPDQLPILQHALMRTWNAWHGERNFDAPIDTRHYESIGGTTRALSHHADEAFGELDERGKAIARVLFRRLSDSGPGGNQTRRPTRLAEIAAVAEVGLAEVTAVVDRFRTGDRTFLMPAASEELRPESVIDISHESFIRLWDRLRGWVEEEAQSATLYGRLADAALRYKAGLAALWRHPELRLALDWRIREKPNEAWAARWDPNFATAIAFLDASQRRRNIAIAIRYATIAALVVLTMGSALAAWSAHRSAQQALSYQLARLAAQSLADIDASPQRSLLLAAESIGLARTAGIFHPEDAAQQLHATLEATGGVPLVGHVGAVTAVAFSHDGRAIATASADGTARLWDAAHPQAVPLVLRGHTGPVTALTFSPDDHWLATASADRTARLWDAMHPQNPPIALSGHQGAINALAISADGRWLATASEDHTARLWDLKAADPSAGPVVFGGHTQRVTSVAFSSTGRWLATGSYGDNTVWLWDMTAPDPAHTGRRMTHKAPIGEDALEAVAFSPDERRLAVTFGYLVQLWDLTAADPPAATLLQGSHPQWIRAVGFSPDGHWLATAGIDATVKLWDLTAGDPAAHPIALNGHRAEIKTLSFSSTGRWLATAGQDATARLWDLTDLTKPSVLLRGHESAVNALSFSPDGLRLATASDDAQARLWDIPDASLDRIVLRGHSQIVRAVAFSHDTRWLATGSDDHTARLWNLTDTQSAPLALSGAAGPISAVSFSPDGHWLVTANNQDPIVRLWNLGAPDPSNVAIQLAPVQSLMSLGFSPDGHWLATASWDGKIRLWSFASGTPSVEPDFLCTEPEPARGVAFTPDGSELATGSHGYTARLWRLADRNPCAHPVVITAGPVVNDLAISPDGAWLATTSWEPDFRAKLWRLADAAPAAPSAVLQFTNRVFSVAFSPDAHWMAAGSWDDTAQLLDVANPSRPPVPLLGHRARILVVAFSPDGGSLASLSEDHTIRLWNPAHPTAVLGVLHDAAGFSTMAFSPDGRWLATGSNDGAVKLWWLRVNELLRLACRAAGRNLTEDEWHTFFAGSSYRKTCPDLPAATHPN